MNPVKLGIVDALRDSDLLGAGFPDLKPWASWVSFLRAAFGLPPEDGDLALLARHGGRSTWPAGPAREAWLVVGRRGGKSRVAALIATYLAAFREHALSPGEIGVVAVIASDRKQARIILSYIEAMLNRSPLLASLVVDKAKESIALSTGIRIEIMTASSASVRGWTLVGAVLDEIAYWPSEDAADPDREIVASLRPGLSTVPGSMLVVTSSPYARRGELWRQYEQHHGRDGDPVLVWQGDTRSMNSTIPEHVVERALAEDEAAARAEWLAEFRADVETFITIETVEACVDGGVTEKPPESANRYFAFVDPSGGSHDSMTLAIAHPETRGDVRGVVLDLLRERRPPFSPDAVVGEFAEILRSYRIDRVVGDRYSGEWCRERFRAHGNEYEVSEKPKSELYGALLRLINSEKVELLDHETLVRQLVALERRPGTRGDVVDHPPRGRDDVANAAAGALVLAAAEGHREPAKLWGIRIGGVPEIDFDFTGDHAAWSRLS